MVELALRGGAPVRTASWPAWPIHGTEELTLLEKVTTSGRWSADGPMETEFSRRFAELHDARYGFCVTSGTIALEVALRAAGIKPGDEVIVPALTWVATASPVLAVGATVVFVDVDPDTYQIDPTRIESAITPRTRAVIPVHLYSRLADLDAITALAKRHGLTVIEDCAHGHGGAYKGRGLGSIGDLGCFSFQASKAMSCGDGGFVTTNDHRLAERVYGLKNCGRAWRDGGGQLVGRNYRMTEFQAAVLLAQLDRFADQAARRARSGELLDTELARVPGIRPLAPTAATGHQPYYGYLFRYDPTAFRGVPIEVFRAALRAEGVSAGPTYGPVPAHDLWVPASHESDRTDSAEVAGRVNAEAVVLNQPLLLAADNEVRDIVTAVRKIHDNAAELTDIVVDPELPAGVS